MKTLEQSCHDIIHKNMEYTNELVYMLYDQESPLAKILSSAFSQVLPENSRTRQFENPPQPLYRWGLINPENPHIKEQNRVITSHNIAENIDLGLNHHKKFELQTEERIDIDPQIESIKDELISLPKWSIVILIQSTNFRLSTFRIRLELFHRGIHVVEFNHLAYIPENQFDTFFLSLKYRTDDYVKLENHFSQLVENAEQTKIYSMNGDILTFWKLEKIRWNTGNYNNIENKWGTFPIGEIFTEAINLEDVNGKCLIDTYPREDFSVEICEPFELVIEKWRVLPSPHFPAGFAKLYNWVVQYEGEVMVRELGFWLNPGPSTATPLADINFHERKVWVHLSLGKKHGIYGKKLPKTEVQRFHIDVFIALDAVMIGEKTIFTEGAWIV